MEACKITFAGFIKIVLNFPFLFFYNGIKKSIHHSCFAYLIRVIRVQFHKKY
jgi:hypothetical protein